MVLSSSIRRRVRSLLLLVSTISISLLHGCMSSPASIKDQGKPTISQAASQKQLDRRLLSLSSNAEQEAGITIAEVKERELDTDVNVTGEVLANANTQTHVTTPVTGRITEILVSIGNHIEEGKPLLIVRSTDIQQAESDMLQGEQQVRSDLKQALIQINFDSETAAAQLKLDEKIYQRLKALFTEKIVSMADFQAAETAYVKDQIMVDSQQKKRQATIALSEEKMKIVTGPAKTKLRLLGVSEEEIAEVMKTQVIDPLVPVLSPESGIIVERLVNVGELIDPSKPLFTIGNFQTVWLKADVFEKDIPKVNLGQPIELKADSFPDKVFNGKLDYVANQVDSDTRTLIVRAEVSNPQGLLKPKMFARMKIIVGLQKVLTIPISAVQDTRTGKVVYVPEGNHIFEERKVKLGSQSEDYVEVLEGLKPGEKVVAQGSFELRGEAARIYSG